MRNHAPGAAAKPAASRALSAALSQNLAPLNHDQPFWNTGELKYEHARKGIGLATTDVTIAAVAIYHQIQLITDNTRHYPMKNISLFPLPN